MSFWTSQTIKLRVLNEAIVSGFCESRMDSASYRLTVGEEVYITAIPDSPRKDKKKIILKDRENTVIPPGQFAFLITEEYVKIPTNCLAFISVRFLSKARGLINVSGFHVDPGYSGRLIFSVYNAGPVDIVITKGDELFSIWFSNLDSCDENPRLKRGYDSIPSDLIQLPDNGSLPYLAKQVDDLEKKITLLQYILTALFTLAMAIFVRSVFSGGNQNSSPPTLNSNTGSPVTAKVPTDKSQQSDEASKNNLISANPQ